MHLTRTRSLLALVSIPLAIAPPALAATSHARLWANVPATLMCGYEIRAPHTTVTQILCSVTNLPVPKAKAGDPFVQISRHGRPHVVYFGDDRFVKGKPVILGPGRRWSAAGVSCTIKLGTARCVNASRHGFTIGNNFYKAF